MKKIIILIIMFLATGLFSREKAASEKPNQNFSNEATQKIMASCAAPRASKELWVNNVRTIIYSGGDMWWDLNGNGNAYYYVPAVSNRNAGVSSCFGGSIWLGGLDAGGQLKVAAMTYRQNGIDFWPGPLDSTNASADPEECLKYDQIYTVSRNEVDNFVASNGSNVTFNITSWPGNGDVSKRQGKRLAPYTDANADGFYDPSGGDYPDYDVNNEALKDDNGFCKSKLYGDLTLFWVFNDNGGIHTETQGVPIGVEVRAQAFGFKTNDEINNMTFYSYEVINRSSFELNQTYFTVWNDPDLGYYLDDYVGCDVGRGLGYIYNADPFDETASGTNGYQDYPPALGCDFFKGPLADIGDGIDNDMDGIKDEKGETIQMSRFTYYNNNIGAFPNQTTNPDIAIHYYNYMTGFWKDGSPFTFGGNAYGGTLPSTFVYDGNPVANTGWTERASGNLPGDRRFLQSAGPFTLKPGAVNDITFGMPWAQSPTKGGNIQSIELLFTADDKAQRLFDNCFKLLDGPEAPEMTIQEVNNTLIFYLTNEKGKSNNYKLFNNDYAEEDISIIQDPNSPIPELKNPDKFYRFEGYIVYQVKGENVSSTDLNDRTKAIPVFQCDVKNDVSRIVNYEVDNVIGALVPVVKVEGKNQGVSSTFVITQDAFSTNENRNLINNKTYYFISVAYAHNKYLEYAQDVPASVNPSANSLGQKREYLEGRKLKKASGIPHNPDAEKGGTVSQSAYGFGPKITRIEGQGNGGNLLTLTRESEKAIVNNFFQEQIVYENAQGPLNIKVVDPLNVKSSNFSFKFIRSSVNPSTPNIGKTPVTGFDAMISGITANTYTGTIATLNSNNVSWELSELDAGGIPVKRYHPNEPTPSTNTASANFKDTLFQSIKVGDEYFFQDLGFSIKLTQVADPGEEVNKFSDFPSLSSDYQGPAEGSFIGASVTYENGASNWLAPLVDVDGETPRNWILSGSTKTPDNEDAYYAQSGSEFTFYDPQKQFGKILGGTWAPYSLCASYYAISGTSATNPTRIFCGPGFNGNAWAQDAKLAKDYTKQDTKSSPSNGGNTDLRKLSSTLVVYTPDKSKWTRCAVLEMQEKSQLSEGNSIFFSARNANSVDKQGIKLGDPGCNTSEAALTSTTGMGWFPGYAINIETGERLNMAFGEDSYQKENNGNDMIWNPTSNVNYPFPYAFGGKHFVYVFGGNSVSSKFYSNSPTIFSWENEFDGKTFGVGTYDYGARIMFTLLNYFTAEVKSESGGKMSGSGLAPFNALERDIMWVSIPMPAAGFAFAKPDQMPSDVRYQINVAKPYRYGLSGITNIPGNQPYSTLNKLTSVNNPSLLTTFIKAGSENNNFPLYNFNTNDIATLFQQGTIAKNALDLIRVVPNPYYGSSTYEINRTDNKVRITNLPNKCTIKIFTLNGTLVRTIKRDVTGQEDIQVTGSDESQKTKFVPYEEWNLQNQSNIAVASGLYIFHIDAGDLGEKIVKWFGVMRPLDVQNY